MPVHDWAAIYANIFHDFHQVWAVAISTALNRGLLPTGYDALLERDAFDFLPDPALSTADVLAPRANRIAIRYRLKKLLCVIEVVSPGNKTRRGLPAFVSRAVELLRGGVHLLVVDLLRPGKDHPRCFHEAIWHEIGGQGDEFTADKPMRRASHVASDTPTAYVEPIAVGDVLPDMPAYLTPAEYVPVPLEATYQAAWASCPQDMRTLVETGHLPDEPS